MAGRGERAYVYAKTCGMLAKSYVGKNARSLAGIGTVPELFRKLVPGVDVNQPAKLLVSRLQDEFASRRLRAELRIASCYAKPDPLLVQYIRAFEVLNVKSLVRASIEKRKEAPVLWDIGRFATVAAQKYPDLARAFAKTDYDWIAKAIEAQPRYMIENGIDNSYFRELWHRARSVRGLSRTSIIDLVACEIGLRNAVWALRLRTYYGMDRQQVRQRLIDAVPMQVEAVLAQFEFPLDSYAPWRKWKYARIISPDTVRDGVWRLDPRDAEARATRYLYRRAVTQFHRYPLSLNTAVCFMKLKEYEAGLIASISEGVQLSLAEGDIRRLLGEA